MFVFQWTAHWPTVWLVPPQPLVWLVILITTSSMGEPARVRGRDMTHTSEFNFRKYISSLIARFVGPQDPAGPHVGPMNVAIWGCLFLKADISLSFSMRHLDKKINVCVLYQCQQKATSKHYAHTTTVIVLHGSRHTYFHIGLHPIDLICSRLEDRWEIN